MKPTPAPIHRREPKPNRHRSGASTGRSDKWPSQKAHRKSKSSQRRYKPSAHRCKAASRAIGVRRAAATRSRSPHSLATCHTVQVCDKRYRRIAGRAPRKLIRVRWSRGSSRPRELQLLASPEPFRAHRGRLVVARVDLFPAPDVRRRVAPALPFEFARRARPGFAVFRTRQKTRRWRRE